MFVEEISWLCKVFPFIEGRELTARGACRIELLVQLDFICMIPESSVTASTAGVHCPALQAGIRMARHLVCVLSSCHVQDGLFAR